MHAFWLALRNLQRNRRRSMTTLLAMVVGVCALLLFGGFSRDITLGMQTDIVQHSGHLQVQRRGFFMYGSGNSAAYGIRDYGRLVAVLRGDPVLRTMALVVTPTLQLGGVAGNFNAGVSRTVMAEGSIAADQSRMQEWNDYGFPLTSRPFALENTAEDAAVTGVGLARVLQLCVPLHIQDCRPGEVMSDHPVAAASADAPADVMALAALEVPSGRADTTARIDVLAANTHGAPNVGSFTVVKAEEQGVKEFDDVYLALHLLRAQRLVYGGDEPKVTAVEVQLRHTNQLPAARQRIEQILATHFADQSLAALDFATLNPFYGQTNSMFSVIFGFMFALVSVIVLFVVSNTMSMAIIERTVEIGTLRAMGMRRGGIAALFTLEGMLLGFAGAAVGVVIALLMAIVINHSGLSWTPPARTDPVALTVRVWGAWGQIGMTFFSLALVAGLSAWWPARHAARLSIVDALRHV
ncbi:FtsX-like permease family protein [Paraburkholderia sp. BL10I2N1]|uniref:ABC transporter permease n=1 Tax=Paraburkholderia sp. BL10I2N1 TaxID=1938796 RepID=UPI00105BD755|nr:FtsX-like permease family protein [Paraburkholderia sp. BL10I2N1]TDN70717.1 putative ABC transport system permease protein [Paraburkholderia sp. BL10I2N1]